MRRVISVRRVRSVRRVSVGGPEAARRQRREGLAARRARPAGHDNRCLHCPLQT